MVVNRKIWCWTIVLKMKAVRIHVCYLLFVKKSRKLLKKFRSNLRNIKNWKPIEIKWNVWAISISSKQENPLKQNLKRVFLKIINSSVTTNSGICEMTNKPAFVIIILFNLALNLIASSKWGQLSARFSFKILLENRIIKKSMSKLKRRNKMLFKKLFTTFKDQNSLQKAFASRPQYLTSKELNGKFLSKLL